MLQLMLVGVGLVVGVGGCNPSASATTGTATQWDGGDGADRARRSRSEDTLLGGGADVTTSDAPDIVAEVSEPDLCQLGATAVVTTVASAPALDGPFDVTFGADGRLYVADRTANRVMRLTDDGLVVFAGTGGSGTRDGTADVAHLHQPNALAARSDGGFLALTDYGTLLRLVDANGSVTTLAGGGAARGPGGEDAVLTTARDVDEAPNGDAVWVEYGTSSVRALPAESTQVVVLAGTTKGYADGPAAQARFSGPHGISAAPDGTLYIGDYGNNRIRALRPDGLVVTVAGGPQGHSDGPLGLGTMTLPRRVVWAADRIFFISTGSPRLRVVEPDGSVRTIAGGMGPGTVDGPAESARFERLYGLAVEDGAVVWLADFDGGTLRRVALPERLCGDGFPCTEDACQPIDGSCTSATRADGSPCPTGSCSAGVCRVP
ncbi:MAG: hypothetical protein H6747_01235 [Deltaproteobacteria bacterium]|nr:hypothetical protein [Deltaproteobacteria bacterium]